MGQPETPALYGKPALPHTLPILLVLVYVKWFSRHCGGQPALLNRHYRGINAAFGQKKVYLDVEGGGLKLRCGGPGIDGQTHGRAGLVGA